MSFHIGGGFKSWLSPRGFLHRQGAGCVDRRGPPGCRGYESGQGLELAEQGWRWVLAPGCGRVWVSFPTESTICSSQQEFGGTYCAQPRACSSRVQGLKGPSAGATPNGRSLHAALDEPSSHRCWWPACPSWPCCCCCCCCSSQVRRQVSLGRGGAATDWAAPPGCVGPLGIATHLAAAIHRREPSSGCLLYASVSGCVIKTQTSGVLLS